MQPEITSAIAQLGAAGLIGWMWLTERRAAAARERQLTEVHDRLVQERTGVELLVRVIEENAKALATLEASQRRLAGAIEGLASRLTQSTQTGASGVH